MCGTFFVRLSVDWGMTKTVQVRTSCLKFGKNVVQQLQLARSSDELFRVCRLVARVQEEVGVVARLAQVHGSVLQAAHGFIIPSDAALQPHITPCFHASSAAGCARPHIAGLMVIAQDTSQMVVAQ